MPAGSDAGGVDSAPGQSPALVALALSGGDVLTFSATGMVSNGPCGSAVGPDGTGFTSAAFAPENGLSDVTAPVNSLMGVFLDAAQPSLTPAPAPLDFSHPNALNFTSAAPALKQVFFIGNGLTSGAVIQQFVVPVGATRLFLGTMDGFEWNNNSGSFSVTIQSEGTPVPEPATLVLVVTYLIRSIVHSRRQRHTASSATSAAVMRGSGLNSQVASLNPWHRHLRGNSTFFLAGVFTDETEPANPAPLRLHFTTGGRVHSGLVYGSLPGCSIRHSSSGTG
jgi:hypothetical protein